MRRARSLITAMISGAAVAGGLAAGIAACGAVPAEAASPQAIPESAKKSYADGEAAIDRREWVECIENFSAVLAAAPRLLDAQLKLGHCQAQLGQWSQAAKTYQGALALTPPDSVRVEILNALAVAHASAGDADAAARTYEQLLHGRSNDRAALLGYAALLRDKGQNVDAIMAYERALEIDPNDVGTLQALGDLCVKSEMIEQAVAAYERWAVVDSMNVEPYRHLGYLLSRVKSCDKGIRVYEKVVALDTSNPGDLLNLGILYQNCGRYEQSMSTLARYRELRPEDTAVVDCRLGFLYGELGQIQDGLDHVAAVAEKRPNDACLKHAWGTLLEKQGIEQEKQEKFADAVASYRQAEARFQEILGDKELGKTASDELKRLSQLIQAAETRRKHAGQ
jgi:tetratricopeptide (TPR) repeat protein